MNPIPDISVEPDALGYEDDPCGGAGDESAATRSGALASLLADPELRRRIGSAWPLYMMLALEWQGEADGTREEIGARMGESGRNVGNWVGSLEQAEIVKVERNGRRMKVSLQGDHMAAARTPDAVTVADDDGSDEPVLDDRQRDVLDLMGRARELGGEAEVRIVVRAG